MVSILLLGGSGTLAAFVNNRIVFALLRITCGMGGIGCYMIPSVMAAESTLSQYKILTTMVVGIAFVTGELILVMEAYFIRDWFTLQLVTHVPTILLLGKVVKIK